MRHPRRRLALLIGCVLIGSALTCLAGQYGLMRLDRALDQTLGHEVPRLMTITELRRQLRSLAAGEGELLAAGEGARIKRLASELRKAERTASSLLDEYEELASPADGPDVAALRREVEAWLALHSKVVRRARNGDLEAAASLARSHSSLWEDLSRRLFNRADQRLSAATVATQRTSSSARTMVMLVFAVSAIVGVAAAVLLHRSMPRPAAGDGHAEAHGAADETDDAAAHAHAHALPRAGDDGPAHAHLEEAADPEPGAHASAPPVEPGPVSAADPGAAPPADAAGLRAILDQVSVAFFAIDPQLRVTDVHTRSLSRLLGREDLTGQLLTECLGLADTAADDLARPVRQVFDDVMPEALACAEIPSRVEVGQRVLQLEVNVVRDPEGSPLQLLFGVTDVTDLAAAETENLEQQTQLRALRESLAEAAQAPAAEPAAPAEPPPPPPAVDGYQISTAEVALIESILEEADDVDTLRSTLRGRLARLRCKPIEQLLGTVSAQVQAFAGKVGKDVELAVLGGDLLVPPGAAVQPALAVLPELLRNAIEHGVEPAGERGDKPPRAPLMVSFGETAEAWEFAVADDGRGLDGRKLRTRATALGLLERNADPRHDEVCALIFAPKLTTVDGDSARGGGLAQVAELVRGLGGTVRVSSEPGFGTTIKVEIPKPASA